MNVNAVRTDAAGVTLESAEGTERIRVEFVTDSVVRVVYTGGAVESAADSPIVDSLPEDRKSVV